MSKNLNIRILTILAVLAAMLFFAFPIEKRINLGLDLKGGMHLILKVETETLDENPDRTPLNAPLRSCATALTVWESPNRSSNARERTRSSSNFPASRTATGPLI